MLQTLNRLSAIIGDIYTPCSPRHVLETILKWTEELLQAESSLVFLPHSQTRTFKVYYRKRQANKPHLASHILSSSPGIETWVFTTGKPILSNPGQDKKNTLKCIPHPQGGAARNFIAVPVKTKAKIIGVLQAMNRLGHKAFTFKQLHFLEMLARHLATALTNAQTFTGQRAFLNEQKQQLLNTTEQLRRANEKLREVDETKSEYIAMVAHELRNPITSISGFAKILHSGKTDSVSREQGEFFDVIRKNAEHIEHLINDLLDLTKLELGKVEMHFEAVSCREMVKEAVLSIQGGALEKKQRIHMQLLSQDIFVEGDRLRLVQVLMNLLSNALKYSPPDSPIIVKYDCETDFVVFSVIDQGQALTPDQQENVFKKFYRIKKSRSAKHPSSGLGLAICRLTIQNHGGSIWVETPAQDGNHFRFRLKRISGPAAPPL